MDKKALGQAVVIGRDKSGYWDVDVRMYQPSKHDTGGVRRYHLRVVDFYCGSPEPGAEGEAFYVSTPSVGYVVMKLSGYRRQSIG